MKFLITILPFCLLVTLGVPDPVEHDIILNDAIVYKNDTMAVMLLRIDEGNRVRHKRINATPFYRDEYCQLLQAIVDEGLCDIINNPETY